MVGNIIQIDFSQKFARVPLISTLEEKLDITIPRPLNSEETRLFLVKTVENLGVDIYPPTTAHLIDKLVSIYIEPELNNPSMFYFINQINLLRLYYKPSPINESSRKIS